jgi:hypothetical protein
VIVIIDYNSDGWYYYYYDEDNYRTRTEGFETHILAEWHSRKSLGNTIEIVYK